ncbi:MAG TPA: NAD(P)-dependent oxidoreductase [Clostridiales bacterium]|nr:MAG: UDP-glucose 4-epimerase [Firmicutes bacterium ADurb.Bin262]HOU10181.1 NAD(P)-dependent oxidoreductase [Clostridiales bacterium]HQK73073.1 NAD(P)-dependent oxidoreductase [Clostridiales bacterium]
MEKILITGGAGYLGSILTPLLLKNGYEVTVLDNFYFSQNSLLDCCANPAFSIIRGDARDRDTLLRAMEGKDYILPLAALVGFPLCDKDRIAARTTNTDAVKLIISLREPRQRIIFPCTNSGYGLGAGETFCTEDSPIQPISLYGITKMEAEKAVLEAGESLTFRFATLFGASPRMRTDLLLNDFVYRAVFDSTVVIFEGHFKRNFLHVRDAAGAFLFAVKHFDEMKGRQYNCGLTQANLSKIEVCEKIREHIPSFVFIEAPVGEDPDKRNYIVSNQRIEEMGWRPAYTLDDGIEELIKAYSIIKNNRYSNI